MVTEDYVSFETAKLLKEKGFPQKQENSGYYATEMVYCTTESKDGTHHFCHQYPACCDKKYEYICAPTLQMAMKWLREVHNLFVFPFPQMNTNKFWAEIYRLSDNQEWENLYCESIDLQDYPTYETACESAIRYCIENLI